MPQLHLRNATEGVAVNAAPAADAVYALPMKLDHTGQICGEAEVIVDEEARRLAYEEERREFMEALNVVSVDGDGDSAWVKKSRPGREIFRRNSAGRKNFLRAVREDLDGAGAGGTSAATAAFLGESADGVGTRSEKRWQNAFKQIREAIAWRDEAESARMRRASNIGVAGAFFVAAVPQGVVGGQRFKVSVNGQLIVVACPPALSGGGKVQFEVPPSVLAAPPPAAPPPTSQTVIATLRVPVPPGFVGGNLLTCQAPNGAQFQVALPPGAGAGQVVQAQVPLQVAVPVAAPLAALGQPQPPVATPPVAKPVATPQPPAATPTKLQCHACRNVFGAPAGATLVQCPTCSAPNRVPASAAPPQHVRVVVPAGCGPGSTFHIALPGSGERLLVRVPPGYGPNSTLTVAARPSIEKQLQAPTRGIPVDTTGDGKANAIGFDTNGDGRINALDTTGDGNIDTLLQA